jgi:hypothetical protein
MASFYTFSPSFDHVFHYSSKWTSLGVYHIPDTLVTGASLWTQQDEDRLDFLNDAILSMRADEIQDLQEYNNKLEVFQRKYATGKKGPLRVEIRKLRVQLQELEDKILVIRKAIARNRRYKSKGPDKKKARYVELARKLKELERSMRRIEARIEQAQLNLIKQSYRGSVADKNRRVRDLKALKERIRERSFDITQAEEERILLLKLKPRGGGGGGDDGGSRERKKKQIREPQAVALLK